MILVDIILNPEYLGCTDPQSNNYNPSAIYDSGDCAYGSVEDIDGNVYSIIVVGEQEWLSTNLKVTHFSNGDPILNTTSSSEWVDLDESAFCYYSNDPNNQVIYGNLYNGYAVQDSRNICPDGWHVAADDEWIELEMYLGMSFEEANIVGLRGTDEGGKLKSTGTVDEGTGLWYLPNSGATDEINFSGIPGGYIADEILEFHGLGTYAYFWTSSETSPSEAIRRGLGSSYSEITRYPYNKTHGYSVRCTKNEIIIEGCTDVIADNYNPEATVDDGSCDYSCIDIDGNIYDTIIIGTQEWMAENLKVTHYMNGDEIPTGFTNDDWSNLTSGAFAVYNDEPTNSDFYGNLYNWFAVDDNRGICPDGFHIPSDDELIELEMLLGMSYDDAHDTGWRGTNQGSQLAGNIDLWDIGDLVYNPTFGSSEYNALPSGYRSHDYGHYANLSNRGYYWSITEDNNVDSWHRTLSYNTPEIQRGSSRKGFGMSIRCVRDN